MAFHVILTSQIQDVEDSERLRTFNKNKIDQVFILNCSQTRFLLTRFLMNYPDT